MTDQATPATTVSSRWTPPEPSPDKSYWVARLREPDDAGVLERTAYGPDKSACIRETARLDRRRAQRRAAACEVEARWIVGYAADIRDGDLVKIAGVNLRITSRTHTPAYSPLFQVTLPDGSTRNLFKTQRVSIFDPDGSVTARIREAGK
jgi:hypothetical protein